MDDPNRLNHKHSTEPRIVPTRPGQRFAGRQDDNLPTPAPSPELISIPASVAGSEPKLALWHLLKADLTARGYWSPTYLLTIEQIINTAYRLNEIRERLDKEGLTVLVQKRERTEEKPHPLLSEEDKRVKTLVSLLARFGMSPQDIVFLARTDPTPSEVIDNAQAPQEKVIYFRD